MRLIYIALAGIIFLSSCSSKSLDSRMTEADSLIGTGDYQSALVLYKKIVKNCPGYAKCSEALIYAGDIEANFKGDRQSAQNSYQKVIELYPLSEGARLARERKASLYVKSGDYLNAINMYAELLQYYPNSDKAPSYLLSLGEAYMSMGNYDQARVELKSLVQSRIIDSKIRAAALFAYAESFFLQGRLGLAEKAYNVLVQDHPDSELVPEAMMKIATCQEERGFLGDAIETLLKINKKYPNQDVVKSRLEALKKRGKGNLSDEKEKMIKQENTENKGNSPKK